MSRKVNRKLMLVQMSQIFNALNRIYAPRLTEKQVLQDIINDDRNKGWYIRPSVWQLVAWIIRS